MAYMLSVTASSTVRPTATLRSPCLCLARLTSKRLNGQVLAAQPRRLVKRASAAPVVRAASSASEAGREVQREAEGFLSDKGTQKAAYGLLAVAWTTVAACKIFFTHHFFEYAFSLAQPYGIGLLGLQRLAGFSSLAPAVAAYTLVKAAKGGRLDSHTYLRQNLALAVAGVSTLFFLWQTPAHVLNVGAQRTAGALAVLTAIVGGAVYSQYSGSGFNPGKVLSGFYNSVIGLLSPDNLNSAVYAFIAAGLGLYSGVLLFGPHELASQWLTVGSGEVSLYLQREIGLSAFLAAVQTYCLKDAADRDALGRSTFKNLNLALAAIAASNATTLWWAINSAKLVSWSNQSYVRIAFLAIQVVTYAYNWIEADRDSSETVGSVESAFENASDGFRKAVRKGEHNVQDLLDRGEDKFDEAKQKGKRYLGKAEDEAEDFGDKAKSKFGRAGEEAEEAGDKAQSKASRFAARAEQKADDAGDQAQKYGLRAKDKAKEAGSDARYGIRNAQESAEDAGDDVQDSAKETGDKAKRQAKGFFKR